MAQVDENLDYISGLVSHYIFDGNANDVKGSNTGTVSGATLSTDKYDRENHCYSFDGTDDSMTGSQTITFSTNPFSINFWINQDKRD
jgi:hypothetical protein